MKYHIDFQFMPKNSARPTDDGVVIDLTVEDTEFALIPSIGDYVDIIAFTKNPEHATFAGRVRSRLFRYFPGQSCAINIVVEEVDDAVWGELVKE